MQSDQDQCHYVLFYDYDGMKDLVTWLSISVTTFVGKVANMTSNKYAKIVAIMATRPKRTKIGDFSAQGWNLPKMHMPTC